jgi:hypothetical protein
MDAFRDLEQNKFLPQVMGILTSLHQLFIGSDNLGIQLKRSSLALFCAQKRRLQGVN